MIQPDDVRQAVSTLLSQISLADQYYEDWTSTGDEYNEPSWIIEQCYLMLLAILEALGLSSYHGLVLADYVNQKNSKAGFVESINDPEGQPFSLCISKLRKYSAVATAFFPQEGQTRISKELMEILHDIHYVIADKGLFGAPPKDETDVHLRIEGILKCFYSDLKHKPTLSKPIKYFEPDTGIPSIETLIEYKYLRARADVGRVADEVLADTRGYLSKEWKRFIYVIYETNRFKPEKEWNNLLKQSGVPNTTAVIVLSGEPGATASKNGK